MVTDQGFDLKEQIGASVQPQPNRPSPPGVGGTNSFTGAMGGGDAGSVLIMQLARIADEMPAWGINWRFRDRLLRAAVHMETFLGATTASLVARYSSLRWVLTGPDELVELNQEILVRGSDFGNGWNSLMRKVASDLLSTDNGAFIEVLRDGPSADAPFIGLAHLDSNRCVRTGEPTRPVIYIDENEKEHILQEHQVKMLVDNPSPITTMRGMQLCAVSRAMRTALLIRDVTNFRREKIGGRDPSAIHLIAGLSADDLEAVKRRVSSDQDQMGRMNYSDPLIFTAFDTEAGVSTASIDLKGLPDGFELDTEMTWYITALALAFGVDYQDIAPLSQGNLGTASQSEVLDRKSRGKGPALWQVLIRHVMNFEGILPEGVNFDFDEEDVEQDQEEAKLAAGWIDTLAKGKTAGILNAEQAQAILLDKGIIDEEISEMFDPEAEALEAEREAEQRMNEIRAKTNPEPNAPAQDGQRQASGPPQQDGQKLGQRATTNQDADDLPGADPEQREDDADDLGVALLKRLNRRADTVLERIDDLQAL